MPGSLVHSRRFGKELLKALGLEGRHVARIVLDATMTEPLRITVTEYVTEPQRQAVERLFELASFEERTDGVRMAEYPGSDSTMGGE